MKPIYLDYNATTPLDPAVRDVIVAALDEAWGNPSSVHSVGRYARALLDDARDRLADTLRCKPGELIFTSGGTEANNLAILGAARARKHLGRHVICSPVEHHAVLHAFQALAKFEGFDLSLLPVDSAGRVDPASVRSAIRPDTVLVSVMAANNETGVLQPVAEIGQVCRSAGVPFHTDALHWFGKEPVRSVDDLNADLVTLCSHKFHGPKGVGVLRLRSPFVLQPVVLGGGHELDRRAGTENLPAILGFVEAAARFITEPVFPKVRLVPMLARLRETLKAIPGVQELGHPADRLSNTIAFTVEGSDSLSLIANLDLAGVCASSGSACSSGSITASHVALAMGCSPARSSSLVRFSLGRETSESEISTVCAGLPAWIAQARTST